MGKEEKKLITNIYLGKRCIGGTLGNPYVKGAKVEAKVLKHGKNKKVKVYKYKQKKKYRRTQGHRQPYTKLEITKLVA